MRRFLIPQIALRNLPMMMGVAAIGSVFAGVYGVLHDQVTYGISPEYFTKLKFDQFHYADFGFPPRVFVAQIGFLATWWVGFFCAWFLARRLTPGQPRRRALRQIAVGFAMIFASALLSAGVGFGYGVWCGSGADYASWRPMLNSLDIQDHWAFIRVAYIHNASYAGGLLGLVVALLLIRPQYDGQPGSCGETNCQIARSVDA
ncbi:MAG TPA: hypothetical protein VMM76_05415 [Pirellulaceae bacterium]|nr:hypothetical protein [Pirellulaceae bacterium]